jgi:hypothetical protein
MRRAKRSLAHRVNGQLRIEFGDDRLTSHAGLEILQRHLQALGFNQMLRTAFSRHPLSGDYSVVEMVRLFLAMILVGARRLGHVRFLSRDPMVLRTAGLAVLPEERTLSRWLGRFNAKSVRKLGLVSMDVVCRSVRRMKLRCLTLDVDGSVVSTGLQVEWAQRGYNPHHRKVPSYYPILVHLAETGQILWLKNRPGNVHDAKNVDRLLREIVGRIRSRLPRRIRLRFRMDGAFFQRHTLQALQRLGVDYAIKVPMHSGLGLKSLIQMRVRWEPVNETVSGFETNFRIKPWSLTVRIVCYRKRVFHETAKNFQLDLFNPDDGTYEYSAVTTNLPFTVRNLWLFMAGRGAQEKTIAELKTGLAFDSVPTKRYAANSAWQWLSVLAHNLHRDLQLSLRSDDRRRTRKSTYAYPLATIQTSRFEWLNLAGRILSLAQGATLRLPSSPEIKSCFQTRLRAA